MPGPKSVKVAICIPAYGDTKAKFTHSLANLIAYSLGARLERDGGPVALEITTFIVSCSMLTESRHRLVAEALHWGADYMLCLDADHMFPAQSLMRLWAHNLPVVGCNYARRANPTAPTAAIDSGLCFTTRDKAEAGKIEEVSHLGLGLCLIDMRVFDVLQSQAEERGDTSFLPLFKFIEKPDGIGVIGEDVFFFGKLREAGIPVHCDHALSWEVGHVHEQLLMNAHAEVQKERWDEAWARRGDRFLAAAEQLEAAAGE
jgi:hypothetical protein